MTLFKDFSYPKFILAFIFLAAGVMKVIDPANTVDILTFFEIFTYENALLFVYVFAITEVLIGLFLITNFFNKTVNTIALVLCIMFLAISVIGYLDNWNLACGCFGRFSFGRFDLGMVGRNSILVIIALWINFSAAIQNRFSPLGLINKTEQQIRS